MKKTGISIFSILGMSLPKAVSKRYGHFFVASAVYLGVATSMINSTNKSFVILAYSGAALFLILGLLAKKKTILAGYKEAVFIIDDYTYIRRYQRRPTGLLLIPEDKTYTGVSFHVAVKDDEVPPLGSRIRLVVPGDAKLKRYKDRVYFSQVYGYETED